MGNTFCCSCSPCQGQNDITTIIMPDVQDMEHVDALITYIDELLSKINTLVQGGNQQVGRPNSVAASINSGVAASINSGGSLIEKLSKQLKWHVCKKCFLSALHRETRKVVFDVLNQAKPIPHLVMALSIIAHVLERAEQTSSNKDECLRLLRYMSVLAKHMKNLDTHLQRNKLDEILIFIVKETLMCVRQMEPHTCCRFIFAPVDAADLDKLKSELVHLYPDLELQALTEILNRLPKVPDPSQGEYPHDAVGIEAAQNHVIELLDLKDESPRVVVIYGVGGIGKTTLATAVFSSLSLQGYHHCKVSMDQDTNERDLPPKQKQILHDLFQQELELNHWNQGREKLSEAFGKASKPVFIFIDNTLKQTNLQKLLPIEHFSRLPKHSRILVTTRNINETKIFHQAHGVEVYSHPVECLPEPEAKKALCHYALGDKNASFDPRVNVDGFVQFCGGIPLVLRIVGSHLRTDGNTASDCNDTLKYLTEWQRHGFEGGGEDVSESVVDFVYWRLKEHSREAFLDIAFFFQDWERIKVSEIIGEMELRDLEGAALVTTYEGGWVQRGDLLMSKTKVKIHDIVRARGKWLAKGNRVTDKESWSIVVGDHQKLEQTKGIWLAGADCDISIEANHLDLTNTSLRVLRVGKRVRVNGRCERAFEHLRFLHMRYEDTLPIDISKSRQLIYFDGRPICEANFTINLPESLKILYLVDRSSRSASNSPVSLDIYGEVTEWSHSSSSNFTVSLIYGRSTSLRELQLCNITFENFETCIRLGNLSCLKILKLYACSKFVTLPENFGNLCSLQSLLMRVFSKLERIPESFGNLLSLHNLDMESCYELERLPESFGNLSSLQSLNIIYCDKLKELPGSFGNLPSLQKLTISGCEKLERLPESFGYLPSLQTLEMGRCMLESLPESFGNLPSLQKLSLYGFEKLCSLSNNFGQLKCLKFLDISKCKQLKRLPRDIVRLSSLVAMKVYGCTQLEVKAMDSLVEIDSLLFLEIVESPMLIKRWEEIQQHRPEVGAALSFRSEYQYGDIISTMLFNGGSTFLHVDGDRRLAGVASSSFPVVGVKVGLLLTACALSHEVRRKLVEVASQDFQIIYVDVDVEGEANGEREKRIKEVLMELPEGSRAWTSSFRKTTLLFAYSLWHFSVSDTSIVGTMVVDEEGRRKLSDDLEMIFQSGGDDSRRVDFTTLFSPLSEAADFMNWY